MLVSVNFGFFLPSRCERFHCNAMRKVIRVRKNWHTIQKNEHILVQLKSASEKITIETTLRGAHTERQASAASSAPHRSQW